MRNNDTLIPLLRAALARQDSGHWLSALGQAGIPAEPVLACDEALAYPQAVARGVEAEIADAGRGPIRTLASPLRLGGTPAALRRRTPYLNEHGAEICTWLQS